MLPRLGATVAAPAAIGKLTRLLPNLPELIKLLSNLTSLDGAGASIAMVFTLFGLLSSLNKYLERFASRIRHIIIEFFTASIKICEWDKLGDEIHSWIVHHVVQPQANGTLFACSERNALRDKEDQPWYLEGNIVYEPLFNSTWFLFNGNLFMFQVLYAKPPDDTMYLLRCLGRSPEPIKRLLKECREFSQEKSSERVLIRTPAKSLQRWDCSLARARRSMNTLYLDEGLKSEIIADAENFLKPEAQGLYNARGVPYRRGYLLHGPPGTGKSSLALALAGHFNLTICVVSLSRAWNDITLERLFLRLPLRCLVLLEDIDVVGVNRETRIKRKGSKDPEESESAQVTLSGLLNVLDGVAAQQGRIVLMTTNCLASLDEALIRPGRVDKIFYLGKAKKEAIKSMFLGLFAPENNDQGQLPAGLHKFAAEFSELVPEDTFSTAQLQGFLLPYLHSPELAVLKLPEWLKKHQVGAKEDSNKEAIKKKDDKKEDSKKDSEEKDGKKEDTKDEGTKDNGTKKEDTKKASA